MPSSLRLLTVLCSALLTRHNEQLVAFLLAENAVLRQLVPTAALRRLSPPQKRSLANAAKNLGSAGLRNIETSFHPDTLLRWYRELIARKYTGAGGQRDHPAPARRKVEALVLRMARENSSWGYTRIRDALRQLGHQVARNTIARILSAHGIEPAPTRRRRLSWATFLKLHWGAIAAMDFFTVEVLTPRGLVRHLVLVVIDLATRKLELVGISPSPSEEWMLRLGRNLTDAVDGFLLKKTKLIVDRDPLFTTAFRAMLKRDGIEVLRLPACSPNLNAYVERAIRSIRYECLDNVIPLGSAHLRHILNEYIRHYNEERHHQGIGGALILGPPPKRLGRVTRRQRLGGLLSFYQRDAA